MRGELQRTANIFQHRRGGIVALMIVVLLVAAAVRFHALDAQSLWYDEGTTVSRAARSVPELISVMQFNIHPPGYFALLSIYEDFAGNSEFALRTFSVLFSVLSVALVFALGKRLSGTVAGLSAAAFTALNTFSIYYAQEARMYALLAALTAASFWVLVMLVDVLSSPEPDRRRMWRLAVLLGLLNAAGLYTHYSFPFMMLAQGLLAVMWLGWLAFSGGMTRLLRAVGVYAASGALSVALFLPWLPVALRQISGHGNLSENEPFAEMLRVLQGWLAFGPTFELSMGGMGVVATLLAVFGLVMLPSSRRLAWWRMLVPVVWVIVPVALFMALELFSRYLRFLTPLQLAFALWMGRGVWVLWSIETRRDALRMVPRMAAVAIALIYALALTRGLQPLYTDDAFQRDDFRGLVQTIATEETAGDGILVSAAGLQDIVAYYYDGDASIYGLPGSFNAPDTETRTRDIIDDHGRLFVVLYGNLEQDPENIVETTLNTTAYEISDRWFDDMRLIRYATPPDSWALEDSDSVQFGDNITLLEYKISQLNVSPGDAIAVDLTWQAEETLAARYKVFVQLLAPDGTLATQHDSEPAGGSMPSNSWDVSQPVSDHHALIVPPDAAAGDYTLIVGLYDANDPARRLATSTGDYLALATIQVE